MLVRLYRNDGKEVKVGDIVKLRGVERVVTHIDYVRRQIVLNAEGDGNPHSIGSTVIGCRWLAPRSEPLPF